MIYFYSDGILNGKLSNLCGNHFVGGLLSYNSCTILHLSRLAQPFPIHKSTQIGHSIDTGTMLALEPSPHAAGTLPHVVCLRFFICENVHQSGFLSITTKNLGAFVIYYYARTHMLPPSTFPLLHVFPLYPLCTHISMRSSFFTQSLPSLIFLKSPFSPSQSLSLSSLPGVSPLLPRFTPLPVSLLCILFSSLMNYVGTVLAVPLPTISVFGIPLLVNFLKCTQLLQGFSSIYSKDLW